MKRLAVMMTIPSALLLTISVTLANMNVVNLLVNDTGMGNGTGADTTSAWGSMGPGDAGLINDETVYGLDGTSGEYYDALQQTVQSGLTNNVGHTSSGGAINLLWALQNADAPKKDSYAYNLLEVYSKLESGVYNDNTHHISAEAIAGSHFNETKLTSFLEPNAKLFGKANGGNFGKVVNGKTLNLENAMKGDVPSRSSKSSVWVDNGPDGLPDGPFQIEHSPGVSSGFHDKTRTDKSFDIYNFVDNVNYIDKRYANIATKFAETGKTIDPRAIGAAYGITHNRGPSGAGWMLFGLPYSTSKSPTGVIKRAELNRMTPEDLAASLGFLQDFMRWFDATNIPYESVVDSVDANRVTAALIILKNGGFFNTQVSPATKSGLESLDNKIIKKIFPDQTNKTIVSHINDNYVKKPWDVLGISRSEYDKIYGSEYVNDHYEEVYRYHLNWYNTSFYIDPNVKSDNYKAGEHVVVRAMEGIAAGYALDTGVAGTGVLMKIALEAGITSLKNESVIDTSNPQTFYQGVQSGSYNPAGAAEGNFGKFLDGLGLTGTLSVTQQAQVQAMYNVSGGPYSQSKRGSQTKDGRYYMDCSLYASVGFHMGYGAQTKKPNPQTGNIKSGVWLTSKNKTLEVDGKTYDAKVVQLDKKGNPLQPSSKFSNDHTMRDIEWLDFVQAGDMINGVRPSGSGHIFTYLGKNKTNANMVLTQDVSKVNAQASVYKPGDHFTMQAYYTANRKYAGGTDAEYSGRMGLAKLWYDTKMPPYHAMRPVYNLK